MNLNHWITELEVEGLSEPWLISHNSVSDFSFDPLDWYEFLIIAADTVFKRDSSTLTFYVWHDEQAFQLRFHAISGTKYELPFEAEVFLVDTPIDFLTEWLHKPNYIKIDELEMDLSQSEPEVESFIKVWALERSEIGV